MSYIPSGSGRRSRTGSPDSSSGYDTSRGRTETRPPLVGRDTTPTGTASPMLREVTDPRSPMQRAATDLRSIPPLSLDPGPAPSLPRPTRPSSLQSRFSSPSSSDDTIRPPDEILIPLPYDLETLKWQRKKASSALARFEHAKWLESVGRPLKTPVSAFETIHLKQLYDSFHDRTVQRFEKANEDAFLILISEDAYQILEKLKNAPSGSDWRNTLKAYIDPELAKWNPTFKSHPLKPEDRKKREELRQAQSDAMRVQGLEGARRREEEREKQLSNDPATQTLNQLEMVAAQKIDRQRIGAAKLEQKAWSEAQAAREKRSGSPGTGAEKS